MEKINYKEIGLKCGIEFHQMLDTKEKLFCHCPTQLKQEKPEYLFERKLRPTMSELGEIDPAALFEFKKGRTYVYEAYSDVCCLVEMDEEPPHDLNKEALEIALMISLMLHSKPVDEVHVMRKIVIDGSNTTGFQRTALIALGGYVDIEGKRIPIQTICLEEDAARKIDEKGVKVFYRLDRLGIPLIEIATAPVIETPEEAEKVAFKIGQLLRVTGRVKRGLGTIRQDLNVSIKGGAKVEIKGVQKLELIGKVVAYEALRQYNLLKIREELLKRGLTKEDIKKEYVDVTEVFKNTKCSIIKKIIKKGGKVYALKLPKFKGLVGKEIQPGRRFGTELADRVKYYAGLGGIFHSDELPKYGISREEINKICEILKLGELDAFILVAGPEDKVLKALDAVVERAQEALDGVPEETRGANPDGTTHFSRPRPGAARMYPETDIRPIRITKEMIQRIASMLPEPPEIKLKRFIEEYKLTKDLAERMLLSHNLELFERLVKETKAPPLLIATTLENTLKSLRRDGIPVENIKEEHFIQLFEAIANGIISKEAIPEVLTYFARNPGSTIESAIKELGLRKITVEELEKIIIEKIKENETKVRKLGMRAYGLLMGEVMKLVRGKIDGKIVSEAVKKKLSEYLKS